jgi:uncharacterized protein YjaG (DUF416 family)
MTFDKARLERKIEALPRALRSIFAAACAERLLPQYSAFVLASWHQSSNRLIEGLEAVWQDPGCADTPAAQVSLEELTGLVPGEDDVWPWTIEIGHAQDAGIAAYHAIAAWLTGETSEAAWAASLAVDAVDSFVVYSNDIDVNDPAAKQRLAKDPLIVAEIDRQERDLSELAQSWERDVRIVADSFRSRARAESRLVWPTAFLGPGA